MNNWGYPLGYVSPYGSPQGTDPAIFPFGIEVYGTAKFADGKEEAPSITFINDDTTGISRGTDSTLILSSAGTSNIEAKSTVTNLKKRVRGEDGSTTAPTYGFSAEDQTGLYRSAVDGSVLTSIAGVTVSILGTHGQRFVGLGSVGAPIISFVPQTQTGLYGLIGGGVGLGVSGQSALTCEADKVSVSKKIRTLSGDSGIPGLGFTDDDKSGFFRTPTSVGVTYDGSTVTEFRSTDALMSKNLICRSSSLSDAGLQFLGQGAIASQGSTLSLGFGTDNNMYWDSGTRWLFMKRLAPTDQIPMLPQSFRSWSVDSGSGATIVLGSNAPQWVIDTTTNPGVNMRFNSSCAGVLLPPNGNTSSIACYPEWYAVTLNARVKVDLVTTDLNFWIVNCAADMSVNDTADGRGPLCTVTSVMGWTTVSLKYNIGVTDNIAYPYVGAQVFSTVGGQYELISCDVTIEALGPHGVD